MLRMNKPQPIAQFLLDYHSYIEISVSKMFFKVTPSIRKNMFDYLISISA